MTKCKKCILPNADILLQHKSYKTGCRQKRWHCTKRQSTTFIQSSDGKFQWSLSKIFKYRQYCEKWLCNITDFLTSNPCDAFVKCYWQNSITMFIENILSRKLFFEKKDFLIPKNIREWFLWVQTSSALRNLVLHYIHKLLFQCLFRRAEAATGDVL